MEKSSQGSLSQSQTKQTAEDWGLVSDRSGETYSDLREIKIDGRPGSRVGAASVMINYANWSIPSLLIDVTVLALAVIVVIFVIYLVPARRRGFYCSSDINRQFVQKKYRFVSFPVFAVFVAAAFLVPILVVEPLRICLNIDHILLEQRSFAFFYQFYRYAGSCLVGLAMNVGACLFTKHMVLRRAPNFVSACAPVDQSNSQPFCVTDDLQYHAVYRCAGERINEDRFDVDFAHMSFYSAYCSCSMHAAVYGALYLASRVKHDVFGSALRPMGQVALLLGPLVIGCALLYENSCHLGDVIAGFGAGVLTAFYSACMAHMFRYPRRQPRRATVAVVTTVHEHAVPLSKVVVGPAIPRQSSVIANNDLKTSGRALDEMSSIQIPKWSVVREGGDETNMATATSEKIHRRKADVKRNQSSSHNKSQKKDFHTEQIVFTSTKKSSSTQSRDGKTATSTSPATKMSKEVELPWESSASTVQSRKFSRSTKKFVKKATKEPETTLLLTRNG